MSDVAAAAPQMVKEVVQVMKVTHTHARMLRSSSPIHRHTLTDILQSIQSVQRQAEGLCDILNTRPSPIALEIHQEVLGHNNQSDAHLLQDSGIHRSRRPIRRAVEEAAAAAGYVPPLKKPVG